MEGRGIVNSFDRKSTFWRLNPQFKAVEPFKTFFTNDHTGEKEYSSNIMWAIAFYCDPESLLKNLPDKYKKLRIQEEFKVDIGSGTIAPYLEAFQDLTVSVAEQVLRDWESKLMERREFLSNVSYELENAEKLDKLMANTPKLFDELRRLKEEVLKEQSVDGKAMGGVRESASDRGDI